MYFSQVLLIGFLVQNGSSQMTENTHPLEKEMEYLETVLYRAEAKNHQLKKELLTLNQQMIDTIQRKDEDSWVAFTVCMTNDKTHAANETILFDKIVINGGNHYDNVTGRFTCPFNGHFTFNLQIRSLGDSIKADIMVDDIQLISVVAQGGSEPYNRQGTGKVNIFCTRGQVVYARNSLSNVDMRGTENCGTNFSGRLLNLPNKTQN